MSTQDQWQQKVSGQSLPPLVVFMKCYSWIQQEKTSWWKSRIIIWPSLIIKTFENCTLEGFFDLRLLIDLFRQTVYKPINGFYSSLKTTFTKILAIIKGIFIGNLFMKWNENIKLNNPSKIRCLSSQIKRKKITKNRYPLIIKFLDKLWLFIYYWNILKGTLPLDKFKLNRILFD